MHQDLIIWSESGVGSRKTRFPSSGKQVLSLQVSIKKEECVGDVEHHRDSHLLLSSQCFWSSRETFKLKVEILEAA